jgi:hypothetical protein
MKAWHSAELGGRCSYDVTHTWLKGARVFRVQTFKDYCGSCGKQHQGAPPDTGEVLDLSTQPTYPKGLLQFTEPPEPAFDGKAAAIAAEKD